MCLCLLVYSKFLEPKLSWLSKIENTLSSSNIVELVLSSWIAYNFPKHLQIIANECRNHHLQLLNFTPGFHKLFSSTGTTDSWKSCFSWRSTYSESMIVLCTSTTLNSRYLKMFKSAWSLFCDGQPKNWGPWLMSCWAYISMMFHLHSVQMVAIALDLLLSGHRDLNMCLNKLRCPFCQDGSTARRIATQYCASPTVQLLSIQMFKS